MFSKKPSLINATNLTWSHTLCKDDSLHETQIKLSMNSSQKSKIRAIAARFIALFQKPRKGNRAPPTPVPHLPSSASTDNDSHTRSLGSSIPTPTLSCSRNTKPRITQSASQALGHFPTNPRAHFPPLKPRYPILSRPLAPTDEGRRIVREFTRICAACGMQAWQCANTSIFTGNEWKRVPRIDVRVEPRDRDRLLRYYKDRISLESCSHGKILDGSQDPRASKRVKLYLVPRNGCEDRPIEVRIGLRNTAEKVRCNYVEPSSCIRNRGRDVRLRSKTTPETIEVFICEGKRAEIVYYMREQVEHIRFGKMASAYLIDKRGKFRVGALLMQDAHEMRSK